MIKTWSGILNFLILQWFFVRLVKIKIVTEFGVQYFSMCDNKISPCGYGEIKKKYKWLLGVTPLTGWWGNYKYVRKDK